jgi:hypothetical protein
MASEVVPGDLEIYVGNFRGSSYGLWWDGAGLVYESFLDGYNAREQTVLTPSVASWKRFWRTLDAIDVWGWENRYEAATRYEPRDEIRDGTHWSLTVAHGDRRVESSGDSAGPDARDIDESRPFLALANAVSRLVGDLPFA